MTVDDGCNVKMLYSVGDLVEWRNSNRFSLAIVQRDNVWDEIRIASLLDSLLANYPIGMLLVCEVTGTTYVHVLDGVDRVSREADGKTRQLLDGQQRINALYSIFAGTTGVGPFYLDMIKARPSEQVTTRQRSKIQSMPHIKWAANNANPFEKTERNHCLDLSRWFAWAKQIEAKNKDALTQLRDDFQKDPAPAVTVCHDIDPAFMTKASEVERKVVAIRLSRLLTVWNDANIPVHNIRLDSPEQVLQVFSRVNLGGVRTTGDDVFFAAVKTVWPSAEESLERVAGENKILSRFTALRLFSRLASWEMNGTDLLPLEVERIRDSSSDGIVPVIERMVADGSIERARIQKVVDHLLRTDGMGYGLRFINNLLFDQVFGWASRNCKVIDDPEWLTAQIPAIENYLIGMSIFSYTEIFRAGFSRLAFRHALEAASRNEPFPGDMILQACRENWQALKYGRQSVQGITTEDECIRVVDAKKHLVLSIVQKMHFDSAGFDWDHIYAQALERDMRWRGPADKGRLIKHDDRHYIWNVGNLWAIDTTINRSLQDKYPSEKLGHIHESGSGSWPGNECFLCDGDKEALIAAENCLRDMKNVPEGMRYFRKFVTGRSLHMWRHLTERFPGIQKYAANGGVRQN